MLLSSLGEVVCGSPTVWELASRASRLLRRFSRRDTCDSLIKLIISFAINRVWLSDLLTDA